MGQGSVLPKVQVFVKGVVKKRQREVQQLIVEDEERKLKQVMRSVQIVQVMQV